MTRVERMSPELRPSGTEGEGLDVAAVRSEFPALMRRVAGSPVVYLDGPGGSQTPDRVIRAVAGYLAESNANCGGPFASSETTDVLLHEARRAAADFLGCEFDEVVFGANTTTINFSLAHALARTLACGDEIIVTELDHDANVSPWLLVAADRHLTAALQLPLRQRLRGHGRNQQQEDDETTQNATDDCARSCYRNRT